MCECLNCFEKEFLFAVSHLESELVDTCSQINKFSKKSKISYLKRNIGENTKQNFIILKPNANNVGENTKQNFTIWKPNGS